MVYRPMARPLHESDAVATLQPYAASKAEADRLLQEAASRRRRRLTIIRPFGFTGVRDFRPRLFPSLIHAAAAGEPMPMTGGEQLRDFCAADGVADAIRRCIVRDSGDCLETFNLGGGTALSVRTWVETVCSELGLSVPFLFGRIPYGPHDSMVLTADSEAARRKLGWQPDRRLSYAVWELAQEMAPGLPIRKPERFQCPVPANSR